jgi:hypothetical protein
MDKFHLPTQVKALFAYDRPKTLKQLQGFLGLANYYRKFIESFAKHAAPLYKMMKDTPPGIKNSRVSITLDIDAEHAFLYLRSVLTTYPLLGLPDFARAFTLATDACEYAIGAVLSQEVESKEKPIAYFSRALSKTQRNYSTSEKELMAIVVAIEHFHEYLYGVQFVVLTDHQPLTGLFKGTNAKSVSRLARWTARLQNYSFRVQYKRGKANGNADAMSRWPDEQETLEDGEEYLDFVICVVSATPFVDHGSQMADDDIAWFITADCSDESSVKPTNTVQKELLRNRKKLVSENNVLFFDADNLHNLLVLPMQSLDAVLTSLHASILGGHLGLKKTLARICTRYYRPFLKDLITQRVKECDICQRVKPMIKKLSRR